MVMANENVWIERNLLYDNPTAPIMVIAYPLGFSDPDYNPLCARGRGDWLRTSLRPQWRQGSAVRGRRAAAGGLRRRAA